MLRFVWEQIIKRSEVIGASRSGSILALYAVSNIFLFGLRADVPARRKTSHSRARVC